MFRLDRNKLGVKFPRSAQLRQMLHDVSLRGYGIGRHDINIA
jgi:hypothetical protein